MIKRQQVTLLVAYVTMCLKKPFKSIIKEIQKEHATTVIPMGFSKLDPNNICRVFHYGGDPCPPSSVKKWPNSPPSKFSPPHQSSPPTNFFSLPHKSVSSPPIVTWNGTLKSKKKVIKIFNNKMSQFQFSQESTIHYYESLHQAETF